MKPYSKPEIKATQLQPLHLLAASGKAFNLFDTEGDNPFDAAPPFFRPPWGFPPAPRR